MPAEVTRVLAAIKNGDPGASTELLPLVYEELRKLAAERMYNEASAHTLQATALVHEAYLRLVGDDPAAASVWDSRGHFFAAAAEAMRRILIDRARAKGARKRGGRARQLRLDPGLLVADELSAELLDLDDALQRLTVEHPAKAELVKLRFFVGLSLGEAAELLGISPATADRHWAFARAWLYKAMPHD